MLSFSEQIPVFQGGIPAVQLYNAGGMLADDTAGFGAEDCPMQLISDTTENDYLAYLSALRLAGFEVLSEHHAAAWDCAEASRDGILLDICYTRASREVRITELRAGVSLSAFCEPYETAGRVEIYQYGLYYDPHNGHSPTTTNCGMLYVMRLPDHRLVMIDGGHLFQWSKEALDGLYRFLRRITETDETEPIRVAAWYFTHGHNDHFAACIRLLRAYEGQIVIERVMCNYLSYGVRTGDPEVQLLKETLRRYCPDVLCRKIQTGDVITLPGVRFTVYYTHQDAVTAEPPVTFPFRDFNCTSSILRMETPGGSVLWLGDTNTETEALVTRTIPRAEWETDVVQIAHHCFNYLSTLYAWIDADYAMLPNSYFGGHTPENLPKLADVEACLVSGENLWYEDKTTGFRFEKGEYHVILEEPFAGKDYDGTGFDGNPIQS